MSQLIPDLPELGNESLASLKAENAWLKRELDSLKKEFAALEKGSDSSFSKYRAVIQNAPWGIFISIPEQYVLEVNQTASDIYGFSQEEFVGKRREELVVVDDVYLDLIATRRKAGFAQGVVTGIRKDGSHFPMGFSSKTFWDAQSERFLNTSVVMDLTEQWKEEQQKKLILESILDYFYVLNWNYEFTYLNQASLALFQVTEKELIGKNIFEVFPILKEDHFFENLEKCRTSMQPVNFQYFSIPYQIWLEETFYPSPEGISVFFKNIDDKKRAEKDLEESNERFYRVTQATFDAIWDTDLLGSKTHWGEGFYKLFGYKPEELQSANQTFEDYLHPEDKHISSEDFQNALKGKTQNWYAEYRFRRKDGSYAFVQDKAIITRDENGMAIRVTGAMHDISRQKQEEQRLKLLESAITHASDAVFILEANIWQPLESGIIFCNRAFTKLYGFEKEEVLGKSIGFLKGRNTEEDKWEKLGFALNHYKPIEFETLLYKKNQEERWVLTNGIPVTNDKGQFSYWVFVQKDTTERKRAELEREQLVKELTHSNKELKQFSYIVSHNLRSPLSNLVAISSLLDSKNPGNPTNTELIEGFKTSTQHLSSTLEDLLKVMVIKETKAPQMETVYFKEVFEEVAESIKSQIQESKALIQTNFSGAEKALFNKPYMESVFLNLITNAIKYAKKDKKPILFIYSMEQENNVQLVFEDNGIGFNMEKVAGRIFGLYQKFHNHPDSKGIGLYLVHSQISSLGGKIEVESQENEGTKFTITFSKSLEKEII
jgi:PAS domain S-box-containing protein